MPRHFNSVTLCVNCGLRWQQSARLRLCRRCERTVSADMRNTQARERDRLEQQRQDAAARACAVPYTPPATREIEVDGQTFTAVWDWSQ